MHRALLIPDVLKETFAFADGSSNSVNARVCKQWSEIALDEVWRVVDLENVFRSLGPMRLEADSAALGGKSLVSSPSFCIALACTYAVLAVAASLIK